MSKSCFIYLTDFWGLKKITDNSEERKNQVENELEDFENLPFVLFDYNANQKIEIDIVESVEANESPDAIFIYHNINKEKAIEAIKKLRIEENYIRVFLVFHTGNITDEGKKTCKKIIEYIQELDIKFYKEIGQHEPDNKFYSTAINFLDPNADAIKKAEKTLGYQLIYDVWKELMLLKLKIKKEEIGNISNAREISSIRKKINAEKESDGDQDNRIEKLEKSISKFEDMNDIDDDSEVFNETLDEFWESHLAV